jgi:hypothetical protein
LGRWQRFSAERTKIEAVYERAGLGLRADDPDQMREGSGRSGSLRA